MEFTVIVDIDGVITNIDFFKYIEPLKHLSPSNIMKLLKNKKEEIHVMSDMEPEKIINSKIKSRILYPGIALYSRKAKIRSNASIVINDLVEEDCNVVIMTKRPFGTEEGKMGDKIRGHVVKHLASNDIPYNKIRYVKSSKVEECIEEAADVIIEDSPKNIIALAEAGFKVICFRTCYNKHITEDIENVYVAENWDNVYSIIHTLRDDKFLVEEMLKDEEHIIDELEEEEAARRKMNIKNNVYKLKFVQRRGYFEKNKTKR